MKNQLLHHVSILHKKMTQDSARKNLGLLLLCYFLISILFRFLIRNTLFRAGIYEEWFIDLTTIGPCFQAFIASLLLGGYVRYYNKEKGNISAFLQSLISFTIALVIFRWFILLVLGGGILVLVDMQEAGLVQNYVEQHFWVDVVAVLMDFFAFRYLYQKSAWTNS